MKNRDLLEVGRGGGEGRGNGWQKCAVLKIRLKSPGAVSQMYKLLMIKMD